MFIALYPTLFPLAYYSLGGSKIQTLIIIGVLVGLENAFSVLASPLVGRIADRTKRYGALLSLGMILLGIGVGGFALSVLFASGGLLFLLLIPFSIIEGVGSAFYHPLGGSVLSEMWPAKSVGRAMGINGSFGSAGRGSLSTCGGSSGRVLEHALSHSSFNIQLRYRNICNIYDKENQLCHETNANRNGGQKVEIHGGLALHSCPNSFRIPEGHFLVWDHKFRSGVPGARQRRELRIGSRNCPFGNFGTADPGSADLWILSGSAGTKANSGNHDRRIGRGDSSFSVHAKSVPADRIALHLRIFHLHPVSTADAAREKRGSKGSCDPEQLDSLGDWKFREARWDHSL